MDKVEQLQEYFSSPSINQSTLKLYIGFDKKKDEESIYLKIGGLVDCKLTTPDYLDRLYYISKLKTIPPPKIKLLLDSVLYSTNYTGQPLSMLQHIVDRENERVNYQGNWTNDRVFQEVLKHEDYYLEVINAKGRPVISEEEDLRTTDIQRSVQSDSPFSFLWTDNPKAFTVLTQVPIYVPLQNVPMKGLLDFLVVDRIKEEIFIVDFKNCSHGKDPRYPMRKYRYDFQIAFYTELLKELLGGVEVTPQKAALLGLEIPHTYKIVNPKIAMHMEETSENYLICLTDMDYELALYGRSYRVDIQTSTGAFEKTYETVKVFPGVYDAISRYKLLHKSDTTNLEYYQTGGLIYSDLWTS